MLNKLIIALAFVLAIGAGAAIAAGTTGGSDPAASTEMQHLGRQASMSFVVDGDAIDAS